MKSFSSPGWSWSGKAVGRLGPVDVLVLSAWCGLAAGELNVAVRIVNRALSSTQRLYLQTRHFVWLVPLVNLVLFLGFGVLLALATRLWPARAGWWSPRLIIVLAIFPVLTAAGRWIYPEAWLLVALGVAFRTGPGAGTASGRLAALAGAERSHPAGAGPAPGGLDLRRRPDQAVARRGPSACRPPARPTCC